MNKSFEKQKIVVDKLIFVLIFKVAIHACTHTHTHTHMHTCMHAHMHMHTDTHTHTHTQSTHTHAALYINKPTRVTNIYFRDRIMFGA